MEEQALAVADFEEALAQGGAQEAVSTLSSYLADLRGAPESLLLQLAGAFRRHLAEAAGGVAPAPLAPSLELQRLLLQVVGGSAAAAREVATAWEDGTAALVYGGPEGEGPAAAGERLVRACITPFGASLLHSSRLARLPPPSTLQQARSLAAWALHLRLFPPSEGAPQAAQQLSLADQLERMLAPAWLGQDLGRTQRQQGVAFDAFAAVLQSRAVRQRLDALPPPAAAESHAAGLRFLLLFRPPTAAATDLWWAHFAALLHALVALARPGGGGLQQPALKHLIRGLCGSETAHMVVQLVLAHPAFQAWEGSSTAAAGRGGRGGAREPGGRGGRVPSGRRRKQADGVEEGGSGGGTAGMAARVREALAVAAELLVHDAPAFLAGCCELLRPEANAPLQARVEALAAMGRAAAAFLEEQGEAATACSGNDLAAALPARLWHSTALDQLLWVLRSDPSVRVRREAFKPLSTALGGGPQQDERVARAAAQRCRDRDEGVRRQALALLARLPLPYLRRSLHLSDWQGLLDYGLAGPLPSGRSATAGSVVGGSAAASRSKPASRHAAAIRDAARELLLRYLSFSDESDDEGGGCGEGGSKQEEMRVLPQEGGEQAAEHAIPTWQRRLQLLLPPELLELDGPGAPPLPGGPAAAAAAQHPLAAWRGALQGALQPEQLAALGLGAGTDGVLPQEAGTEAEEGADGRDVPLAAGDAAGELSLEWD